MIPTSHSPITWALFSLAAALAFISGPAFAEWVERPDPMHEYMLTDFDSAGDRVRVLYQSMPSLQQAKNGTINVYVAELFPHGRVENRQLATGQRYFSSLVLQRGGDGVFVVATPERKASSATLEYWSAQDGSLRSSFDSPALVGLGGNPWPLFPTDDGSIFVVAPSAQTSAGDRPTTLTWTKMSPSGEVLAEGQWSNPTAVTGVGGGFPAPGGGLAMTLNMRLVKGMDALQTDAEAVQQFQVGERTLEARVFSETRLLAADAPGAFQWLSPALERDLMWGGEMSVPQDLPIDQMMAQNNEQMALMSRVTLENGGERRLVHLSTVGYDDVQRTPKGYGMLARVAADRSLQPPQHGVWFLEVGEDGALLRELRIEPAAERLDAKFERFMPTEDGGLLVAGIRRSGGAYPHLTALGPKGDVEWTARLRAENSQLEGIGGTEESPWVFGHGFNEAGNKNLMWAELVDPDDAQRLAAEAPAAATTPQPRPRATPEPTAPPTLELPEPAEGCACSCEEFAQIQALSEKAKSMPQAEMLAMISDPAYQTLMNCMAGCAMQYAQCR